MNQNLEGNLHNETKRGENIRAGKSRWHQGFRVVCFFLGLVLLLHGASIADSGQAEDLPGRELVKMFDLNFFAEVIFLTLFHG